MSCPDMVDQTKTINFYYLWPVKDSLPILFYRFLVGYYDANGNTTTEGSAMSCPAIGLQNLPPCSSKNQYMLDEGKYTIADSINDILFSKTYMCF
jgi:hypothetical protein